LESAERIREALTDSRVIFICAGLRGGTGSGAAPYLHKPAVKTGALVIRFCDSSIWIEGKRRNAQAREALVRLSEFMHMRGLFRERSNGDLTPPRRESSGIRNGGIWTIKQARDVDCEPYPAAGTHSHRPFDDLLAALRTRNSRWLVRLRRNPIGQSRAEALTQR